MKDVIFIQDLQVTAIVGVLAWERSTPQKLLISCQMAFDIAKAAGSDDVMDTIDYKSVCDDIIKLCQARQAKLVETLAHELVTHLLSQYPCEEITLSITKPCAITQAAGVGVKIIRHR